MLQFDENIKTDEHDLKKYYKYVYKCKCGRYYGSFEKERVICCPICIQKKKERTRTKSLRKAFC